MPRLSGKEKIGYALGDTASNFFFQTFNIFLLIYYTDTYGLAPAAVGTMFFLTKFWDALNDPLMGIVADRTVTRWGKFRPYLLWMAVPYGVMGYLMFAGPEFSGSGKLLYAYVTYTLMMMFYTAINVPYSALLGVISPSSAERTLVSSYRFVFAFGGGLLVSMLVRPLVRYFGVESEAQGYSITMALFAFVSVLLFWTTFATTKERVRPPATQNNNLRKDLAYLLSNLPWLIMFISAIFVLANVAVRNGAAVYFFKYVVGDDNTSFIWIFDKTSVFLTTGTLAMIAGVASTRYFNANFDKRTLMIALTSLNALSMIAFYFIPPDQYWLMVAVNIVGTYIVGPTPALVWSMMADAVDYGEWRFGRRTTGLAFSAVQFAQKMGLAIGVALAGWLLSLFGFMANQEQSESSLLGIRLLFTVFPAAFAVTSAVVLCFYPLKDSQLAIIERELIERKGKEEPAPAW